MLGKSNKNVISRLVKKFCDDQWLELMENSNVIYLKS